MTLADFIEMAREEAESSEPINPDDVVTAIRVALAAGETEFALRMLAAFEEQAANAEAYILNQAQANPGVRHSH